MSTSEDVLKLPYNDPSATCWLTGDRMYSDFFPQHGTTSWFYSSLTTLSALVTAMGSRQLTGLNWALWPVYLPSALAQL